MIYLYMLRLFRASPVVKTPVESLTHYAFSYLSPTQSLPLCRFFPIVCVIIFTSNKLRKHKNGNVTFLMEPATATECQRFRSLTSVNMMHSGSALPPHNSTHHHPHKAISYGSVAHTHIYTATCIHTYISACLPKRIDISS